MGTELVKVYQWKAKRSGGGRLIESPKPLLKGIQTRILRDILDRVPLHAAAHGFAKGRSIASNAKPHCGQAVVVKWDLADFYPSVRFNRVVAIFRSLGYSREAAVWLFYAGVLARDGVLVVETARVRGSVENPGTLELARTERYGSTSLLFFKYRNPFSPAGES